MPLPTLLTQRLILRPLQDSDAPAIASLAGEWVVAGNTRRIPYPYGEAQALDFIAGQRVAARERSEYIFGVCNKGDKQLIGCVGAVFDETGAELGYWFGRAFWGQGFATEAGRCMVDYLFGSFNLWQINAHHLMRNPASGRVLGKLGFNLTGMQEVDFRDGKERILTYELLHASWFARPDREGFV